MVVQPRYSRAKLKIAVLVLVLEYSIVGKREWERKGYRERAGFSRLLYLFYSVLFRSPGFLHFLWGFYYFFSPPFFFCSLFEI